MDEDESKRIVARLDRALEHTAMPDANGKMKRMKRPRLDTSSKTHPNKGGWRGHPNSLLALELHRARTQLGNKTGSVKSCTHCTRPALRGLSVCHQHGGAPVQKARRIADGCARYSRPRSAGRVVDKLLREGALPRELLTNSVFAAVEAEYSKGIEEFCEARQRLGHAPARTPQEISYRNAVKMLRWELVRAWMAFIADDDRGPWVAAVGKARELGLIGG